MNKNHDIYINIYILWKMQFRLWLNLMNAAFSYLSEIGAKNESDI